MSPLYFPENIILHLIKIKRHEIFIIFLYLIDIPYRIFPG
jgi:hypothetical protein